MADETRQAAVEAAQAAVIAKYGDDGWMWIFKELLTEISISLAMLVDNSSSST